MSEPGPAVIVVSGATRSIVQLKLAGDGSALPAASTARTTNECGPSSRLNRSVGEAHATSGPASIEHWKLAPDSDEKVNLALPLFVSSAGVSASVVSGGWRSTVHVHVTAGLSVLPDVSVARTEKVCGPSTRP